MPASVKPYWVWLVTALALGWMAASPAQAQVAEQPVYQLSGLVVDAESGDPVPYAAVRIMGRPAGTVASPTGYFSLPVLPTDTLRFTRMGYAWDDLALAQVLASYPPQPNGERPTFLYWVTYLSPKDARMDTVVLHPYRNALDVRNAMLNLSLSPDDPLAAARANLDPQTTQMLQASLGMDQQDRLNVADQIYYQQSLNRYTMPTVGLDPLSFYRQVEWMKRQAEDKAKRARWDD